jgi:hypothetical protein
MFADLSPGAGNTPETWHQRQGGPQLSQRALSTHDHGEGDLRRAVPQVPSLRSQGRARVSDEAPSRNAAAADRLSSIRQS